MTESQAPTLVEQEQALHKAKAERITYLLDQRIRMADNIAHNIAEINTELRALGYKRPRAKAAKKVAP